MTTDTTIGIWSEEFLGRPITISELYDEVVNKHSIYSPKQLCDWRYSTNLMRFTFDPYTGEQLNWKQIKYFLEHGEFQKQP